MTDDLPATEIGEQDGEIVQHRNSVLMPDALVLGAPPLIEHASERLIHAWNPAIFRVDQEMAMPENDDPSTPDLGDAKRFAYIFMKDGKIVTSLWATLKDAIQDALFHWDKGNAMSSKIMEGELVPWERPETEGFDNPLAEFARQHRVRAMHSNALNDLEDDLPSPIRGTHRVARPTDRFWNPYNDETDMHSPDAWDEENENGVISP